MSTPGFSLQDSDGTTIPATSECEGDDCMCLNYPDDSVQTDVVQGGVRIVGVFSIREGDCRYVSPPGPPGVRSIVFCPLYH